MRAYEQYHGHTWKKLFAHADNDEVAEFFKLYQEYLEKSNLISNQRIALHKMVKKLNED